MNQIYLRTAALIGAEAVQRLNQAHVLVAGLGGVGAYAAEALARAGIGTMTLIDDDIIEPSNLNRQLVALHSTIGRYKTDVVAERLLDINPALICHVRRERLAADIPPDLTGVQAVADCIDDLAAKATLIETAYRDGRVVVSAMGTGFRLDAGGFQIADLSKTHGCPLARALRKRLRDKGITEGIQVVFSGDPVVQTASHDPIGTISYVPGVCGLLVAQAVIGAFLESGHEL